MNIIRRLWPQLTSEERILRRRLSERRLNMTLLIQDIRDAINKHSRENYSNTPDLGTGTRRR